VNYIGRPGKYELIQDVTI